MSAITIQAQEEEQTKQQLFIKPNDVKKTSDFGNYKDQAYRDFYNVNRLTDNLTNSYSFWGQNSNSGFTIELKNPINQKVCSVELGVNNPVVNSPFSMNVTSSNNNNQVKNVKGVLDSSNKNIDIPQCIEKLNEISFAFNPADKKWVILSELRLFSNSTVIIPDPEPIICPTGQHYNKETKKCEDNNPKPTFNDTITNSTIEFNVSNSSLNINADEASEIIINVKTGGNVTTITNSTEIITPSTTPIGTPLPPPQTEEELEEIEEEKAEQIAKANKEADKAKDADSKEDNKN